MPLRQSNVLLMIEVIFSCTPEAKSRFELCALVDGEMEDRSGLYTALSTKPSYCVT